MRLDCTNLIKPTPNVIHRVLPFVTILREYMFVISLTFENHLIVTPNFESRKFITKFRCSDHELMIEKGIHKKVDAGERLCNMCSEKGGR